MQFKIKLRLPWYRSNSVSTILDCLCVEVSIIRMKDIFHRGNFWLVYGLFHDSHFVIDRNVKTHTAVMVGRFTERNFYSNTVIAWDWYITNLTLGCTHFWHCSRWIPLFPLKMYRKGMSSISNTIIKIRKGLVLFWPWVPETLELAAE